MSDEKKREKEEIVEVEGVIDHFYHEHPLALNVASLCRRCYGCRRYIYPKQTAYSCREGCSYPILHEECAEMPREIRLSMHPHHTLIQKEVWHIPQCAVCKTSIVRIGYYCTSSGACQFQVHVGCAKNIGVVPTCIDHPSHPLHQLTLMWRPGRSCLSRCDACGTLEKGSSYMCFQCQYWIHTTCATLPPTHKYDHHHHPLSLVYDLPFEYIKFDYHCRLCLKDLFPRFWAYHCETCRYVVHVKCAIKTSSTDIINIDTIATKDEEVIMFPTNNAAEEQIPSFVTKVGGAMPKPNESMLGGNYKFHNHDHQLHLTSPQQQQEEGEEEDSYDEDDGLKHGELVCDGCTMPIFSKKQNSSVYYMSCGECKYFLHWACFHLPTELPSHPLHQLNHNLVLQTPPKLDLTYCGTCRHHTNGLFYKCTKCDFQVDIKCASLPNTIKHKAHPRHHLKLLNRDATRNEDCWQRLCGACGRHSYGEVCYKCDICDIFLHASCALLPPVVSNSEWDKHPLPLMWDASIDHPSDFYCEVCEVEMNPQLWMYHCRDCDFSLHPRCYRNASGDYRNIKKGLRYTRISVY